MTVQEGPKTYNAVIVGSPNVNPGYKLVGNELYPQTTLGVANASVAAGSRICVLSEMSVRTTNCKPINAPADEPTMT